MLGVRGANGDGSNDRKTTTWRKKLYSSLYVLHNVRKHHRVIRYISHILWVNKSRGVPCALKIGKEGANRWLKKVITLAEKSQQNHTVFTTLSNWKTRKQIASFKFQMMSVWGRRVSVKTLNSPGGPGTHIRFCTDQNTCRTLLCLPSSASFTIPFF